MERRDRLLQDMRRNSEHFMAIEVKDLLNLET